MTLFLALLPSMLVALGLTAIEHLRRPAQTDWLLNLQAWATRLLVTVIVLPVFRIAGLPSLLDGAALPFWLGFPVFLVVMDLAEYLFHRAQHRVPLLWAMHSLHHSDPEMSALTTERHFWADQLFKSVTVWAAALLVIAPTAEMVGLFAVISLWNFVSHSRLRLDLGRWSWLLNTPAYHRRHHSRLPEHFDSNFAALFPLFDVIAGSYHRPDGFPPTGLSRAPQNWREMATWPAHHAGGEDEASPPRSTVSEA